MQPGLSTVLSSLMPQLLFTSSDSICFHALFLFGCTTLSCSRILSQRKKGGRSRGAHRQAPVGRIAHTVSKTLVVVGVERESLSSSQQTCAFVQNSSLAWFLLENSCTVYNAGRGFCQSTSPLHVRLWWLFCHATCRPPAAWTTSCIKRAWLL